MIHGARGDHAEDAGTSFDGAEGTNVTQETGVTIDLDAPSPAANSTVGPSLSPSRAGDFLQCPLLFRFRVLDKIPEAPAPAAVRGTLVHAVLERVFDLPPRERTVQAALSLVGPEWDRLRSRSPESRGLFPEGDPRWQDWLTGAEPLIARWFEIEDPTRVEPAERELYVETILDNGLRLRGFVDRLDIAADGQLRVVDYKTGRAPSPRFEGKALFQMKFYGLVLWRIHQVVPSMLQLVYLGSGEAIRLSPNERELLATERKIRAIWEAITQAALAEDWRASPGRLCDWCDHRTICPAWGGTPPPVPEDGVRRILDRPSPVIFGTDESR
jgi:putative RecB family exonuclease